MSIALAMQIFFQEVWGYKISQMAQVILVVLLTIILI